MKSTLRSCVVVPIVVVFGLMALSRRFGDASDADPATFVGIYEGRSVTAWTQDLLNRSDDTRRAKLALSLLREEAADALPALLTRWEREASSPGERELTAAAAGATAHRHEHLLALGNRLRLERDDHVRLRAVRALGPRDEAERDRWELLFSIAISDSGAPQVTAIEALGDLPPRSAADITAVRRLLGAQEDGVAFTAARTMARWGVVDDESASRIRVLLDASSDPVERMGLSAALVSSAAEHDHGVKALTDVLSRYDDAEVVRIGLDIVAETGRRGAAMRPVVALRLSSKEPRTVEAALEALRSIGLDPAAEDGIVSALHSPDIRVRLAATGAAATLLSKDIERVAAEIRRLELDPEPQIRLAASLTTWMRGGKQPDDGRLEEAWSKADFARRSFIIRHLLSAPVLPLSWRKVLDGRVSREPEASLRSGLRRVVVRGRFAEDGK